MSIPRFGARQPAERRTQVIMKVQNLAQLPKPSPGFPTSTPRWRWADVDTKLSGSANDAPAFTNPEDDPGVIGVRNFRDAERPRKRSARKLGPSPELVPGVIGARNFQEPKASEGGAVKISPQLARQLIRARQRKVGRPRKDRGPMPIFEVEGDPRLAEELNLERSHLRACPGIRNHRSLRRKHRAAAPGNTYIVQFVISALRSLPSTKSAKHPSEKIRRGSHAS
jgi:hypothetical protein